MELLAVEVQLDLIPSTAHPQQIKAPSNINTSRNNNRPSGPRIQPQRRLRRNRSGDGRSQVANHILEIAVAHVRRQHAVQVYRLPAVEWGVGSALFTASVEARQEILSSAVAADTAIP